MRFTLFAIAAVGLAVSCGGGDDSTGGGTPAAGGSGGSAEGGAGTGGTGVDAPAGSGGKGGSAAGGASTGGSGGTQAGGGSGQGGSDAGGSGGTATGGGGGATSGAGGTAGTAGTAGMGGTAGTGGMATGGSGGGGNQSLCKTYCDLVATTPKCMPLPQPCEPNCQALLGGACSSKWKAAISCAVQSTPVCDQASCQSAFNGAAQCNPGPVNLCVAYCQKATSAPGCTSTDADACYETCGTSTFLGTKCAGPYQALYSCAIKDGTPACAEIDPGSTCANAEAAVKQCAGAGAGGSGGSGGSGGGGAGGTAGAGGSGGAGGGCAAPSDPASVSCSMPDGDLKLTGNTTLVAVTYAAATAPASCTSANSELHPVQNGKVVLPLPDTPGCKLHRVCNYNSSCKSDYSPGKVFSRCQDAGTGYMNCTVP